MSVKQRFAALVAPPKTQWEEDLDIEERILSVVHGASAFVGRGSVHIQRGHLITKKRREQMWNQVKDFDFKGAARY